MNYERNAACPCGSGKKYKHCCGKPVAPVPPPPESHEGAVERVMAWLAQHHRKAFATALTTVMEDTVFGLFDDDEQAEAALASIDDELFKQIHINLTEWLLAEGDILVKGEMQTINELLLGPRGPSLSVGQRAWIEQLSHQPLRLFDITEVVRGVSITVCDALDAERPPLLIIERAGSQTLRVGTQIGARVMQTGGQNVFSGAIYPFSIFAGRAVHHRLRELAQAPSPHEEDNAFVTGMTIIEDWLAQYLLPAPVPDMIDSHSGEPLLLTTDHYTVHDWDALSAALAAQPDVEGDRTAGWSRLLECDDGQTRSQAAINPEAENRRVGVFYKTAGHAERGRAWFDALAGDAVKFELREVSDPKGLLSRRDARAPSALQSPAVPAGLTPEIMANAMESYIKRSYANWADEPLPALQDRTPRQAMQSEPGLERVKGLLRSYEEGETQQATQQGRRQISFQFLWDALGLQR